MISLLFFDATMPGIIKTFSTYINLSYHKLIKAQLVTGYLLKKCGIFATYVARMKFWFTMFLFSRAGGLIMSSLPHVKKPCSDCPFRKDTKRGWLGADRMNELVNASSFVCHKKTDKQCAGHMLINGQQNDFVRLVGRLGLELELSGKELVFDTKVNTIA